MFKSEERNAGPSKIETIIGPSVKVEGDFEGEGDIVVEGIVVGNLKTKNFLKVGKDAKISANIEAQGAFIAGEINGNLKIKSSLELTASAKVTGDIETAVLAIEKGAFFMGKINMNNGVKPAKNEVKES